jgi:hypothetical protein
MSVYDYEAAPPPPPMYHAKAVKDKSLKDEVLYLIEFYSNTLKRWDATCLQSSLKGAKRNMKKCQERDKKKGFEFKYRIVKFTIKKEVVK